MSHILPSISNSKSLLGILHDSLLEIDDEISYISSSILSNDESYIKNEINNIKTSPYITKFEYD